VRIAFITSSLEPSLNAVGDYARNLAVACSTLGHECVLLALGDPHVQDVTEELQPAQGVALRTLRVPGSLPASERIRSAQSWLARRSPHWISLQFAAHRFHSNGSVGELGSYLAPLIGEGRALHVMLHELWSGIDPTVPRRWHFTGALQRRALLSLLRQLQPDAIHTASEKYREALEHYGIRTRVLLPGSVPAEWTEGAARFLSDIGIPPERTESAGSQPS
jgi:Glycosyltransferase Family 4